MHQKIICYVLESYLLCIGFMFAVHQEVISRASKSYLPLIGTLCVNTSKGVGLSKFPKLEDSLQ